MLQITSKRQRCPDAAFIDRNITSTVQLQAIGCFSSYPVLLPVTNKLTSNVCWNRSAIELNLKFGA